jgi:hypothetical protein
VNAEGWYRDPYKMHEDRWFSQDPPPARDRPNGPLVASVPLGPATGPEDLRRADDDERRTGSEDPDYAETATEATVFMKRR